jgi:hypothetical protein
MLTTQNLIRITAALFLSAILPMESLPDAWAQPDRREQEHRQQQELRELEAQQSRLRAELEEIEAAKRRLTEALGRPAAEPEHRPDPDGPDAALPQLKDELHELRVRESDLRAAMDQMQLAGRHDDAHKMERELVQLRHARERIELEMDRRIEHERREAERRELAMMTDRLDYVDNWHHIAFDPQRAVMMATQAIVEIHMASGRPQQAVEILEGLMERVEALGSRTAIRFALRDIYMETGTPELAAQHMVKVILENSGDAR